MTDNEIIKALECCSYSLGVMCKECPSKTTLQGLGCKNKLSIATLDLINSQKAEIERLKGFNENLQTANTVLSNEILEIKSEAIKEFAEELEYFVLNEDIEVVEPKCKDYESYINGANQFRHQIKNGINNLVKEMTERAEK